MAIPKHTYFILFTVLVLNDDVDMILGFYVRLMINLILKQVQHTLMIFIDID